MEKLCCKISNNGILMLYSIIGQMLREKEKEFYESKFDNVKEILVV